MWIVFHSCVEGLVCISTGMWGVCSTVVCISIGSVCSTVMWRGLCAFPQACGECVFHSCVEALCEFQQEHG